MLTALLMAILAIFTPVVVDAAPAADTAAVTWVVVDAAPAADTTANPASEVVDPMVKPTQYTKQSRKKASSRALYGPPPKELGVSKRRVRKGKASVAHTELWMAWGINPLGQLAKEAMAMAMLGQLAKDAICLGFAMLVALACIYGDASAGDTIQNAASVFTVNAVKFGEGESAGKTARLRIKTHHLEMVEFAIALAGKLGYSITRDEYTSDLKSKGRGSQRMADTVGIEREMLSVHFKGHLLDGLRLQAGELEKVLAQFPEPLSSLVVEAGVKPEEPIHIRQKAWPETLSAAGFVMTNASKVMKRLGSLWATPTETFEKIDVVINPLWTGAKHDGDALMEDPSVEPGTCYFAQFRVYTDEGMIKGFCMVVHGPKRKLVSGPENLKSGLNCSRRFGFLMDRIVAERALQVGGSNPGKGHATASWMLFVQMIWTQELISYFKELIKWSADGAYHRMRWAIQNGTLLELLGSAEDPEDDNEEYEESEPGQTRIDRDIAIRRMREAGVSTRGFLCLMTLMTNMVKGWSKPYYEGFDKKTGIFALANTLKKMGALLSYSCRGKFYSLPYFIQGMGWERVKAAVLQQEKGIEKISFNKERGCIVASSTNKKTGNLYTWEIHMLQTDLIEGMPRGVFLVSDDFAVDILKLLGGADKDGDEGSAVKTKGKGRGWGSSKNGGFEEKELTNPTLLFRHPIGSGEGILIESKSLMVRYKALKKTIGTNSKGKRVQRPIPPMPTPEFRNFEIIECPEELQDTYDNKPWSNEHTRALLTKRFASDPLGEKINCNLAQFLYAKNPRCFGAEATVDGYQQETTKAEFFAWAAMKASESSATVMQDGVSPAGTIRFGLDPEDCTILQDCHFFDELSQFKAETFEEYRDQLVEEFTSPKGLIEGRLEEFERLLEKSKALQYLTKNLSTRMSQEQKNGKQSFGVPVTVLTQSLNKGEGYKALKAFNASVQAYVRNTLPKDLGEKYCPQIGTLTLWIGLNLAVQVAKATGNESAAYQCATQAMNDLNLPNKPASGGFDNSHPLLDAFEWLRSTSPEDPNPEGDGPQDDEGPELEDLPQDLEPDTDDSQPEDLPQDLEPDTADGDKLTVVMGPHGEYCTVDELADYTSPPSVSDTNPEEDVSDDAEALRVQEEYDEKTSPPEATAEELVQEFFENALFLQEAQGLGIPKDQYDALKGIVLGFVAGKTELILNGAAGCGKTFLVKLIVDCLKHVAKGGHRVFNSVDLCSFTGTAQLNLQKATGMDACTIHTLIGVEDVQGHLCLKKDIDPAYRALIINDEATMTSPLLGQKLRKLASGQGSAILWVGDMAQLPPVLPEFKGKEINRWLHDREVGPEGPAPIMESGIERFHLTTNFRQAKGGTILAIANIFRSIFMAGWNDNDSTKNGRTSWVIQGDDEAGRVITNLINGSDQVERGTIDIERLVKDPGENAAIFPTNRMADGTNNQCVNHLGCKSTAQDPIPVGATMMVSVNKLAHCEYIEDGVVAGVDPLYLANGSRVKVVAVENHGALNQQPEDPWRTYNCLQLDVVEINGDGRVWRIYTDVNFDNKYGQFFNDVNPLVLTSWSRLYKWSASLSEEQIEKRVNCSFKMKYGWAMTVHKSQGLGFDRIYTTADVLYGRYSNMQMGHNVNLSYTAITRAKAKIILV